MDINLKKEIGNSNILRITLLFFAVSSTLVIIAAFLFVTNDITLFSESGDTLFKFFIVILLVSSIFLDYIVISVFFRSNVLSKISMFADNRLGAATPALAARANNSIVECSKIFKGSGIKTYLFRQHIVRVGDNGLLVRKEFKASNVSGLIIALIDKKINFNGKALLFDSITYEKMINLSEYGANSSAVSGFNSYFSSKEMEEQICSNNVLNAINQIKSAYNKNICISFMNNTVCIIVEGEKLQSNFNDENVMKIIEQTKSIMNLYNALS